MTRLSEKSVGFLIDELITTSMKCWWAQEHIMDDSLGAERQLLAAKRAQELNNRRNQLIRAIDEKLGEGDLSPTTKSYHTYFEKKDKE